MIRDIDHDAKRCFGRLAYVGTAVRTLSGLRPHRFEIVVDGSRRRLCAKQVFIANGGYGVPRPSVWGRTSRRTMALIDPCLLNGRTVIDFAAIGWDFLRGRHRRNRQVRSLRAQRAIALDSRPRLPVQGDGEIAGQTSIEIRIRLAAVAVALCLAAWRRPKLRGLRAPARALPAAADCPYCG